VSILGFASTATEGAGDPTLTRELLLLIIGAAVGATFTLLVSFVVQVRVVPGVAAKTRRQERWENDVLELWTLLSEQLGRAVKRYRTAAFTVRAMEGMRDEVAPEKVRLYDEQQRRLEDGRRDARTAVEEHLDRVSLVFDRVRRFDSQADAWHLLDGHLQLYRWKLSIFLSTAAGETAKSVIEEAAIDAAWKEQEDARKKLVDLLEPVVQSMKPPQLRLRQPPKPSVRPEDHVTHVTRCPPKGDTG
jgi:hypothetical protein